MPRRKPKDKDRSPDLPHEWIARHLERLAPFATIDPIDIPTWQYRRSRLIGPTTYEKVDDAWGEIQVGEMWGGADTTAFFRAELTIPKSHAGADAFLDIDLDGGETQLCINGRLFQGLDFYRSLVPLGELAQPGKRLLLEMEAFIINYPFDARRQDQRELHRFARARLIRRDPAVEQCLFDMRFVLNAYRSYWQSDTQHEIEAYLLHHLTQAARLLGPHLTTQTAVHEAACLVSDLLQEAIFESSLYRADGRIILCPHSHLDIVYLWPIKETYRKNGRTTSNMLSLLREFPEYIYSQSQPFLYEKLAKHYPDLFEEVRHYVMEGRWEVIGGMYVEPDGNLLGPESWVRQIMIGKRVLQELLGVDTAVCWMPDVFGVLYTLPQILKKSGIDYFMTNKLNIWNDTNIFPHDTFRWRGPDGSEVITHFPPTHFAQDFSYDNLRRHWRDFREKQTIKETLFVYGWGDGGGGPTREMVSRSIRAKQLPGLPKTEMATTQQFFDTLSTKQEQLPIWDDELYLEAHRGTYTSKGELKRQNRKAELLYRDVEILSAMALPYGGPRIQERLNEGWKHILLNQFHDTLPGSHVVAAVPDITHSYDEAFAIGDGCKAELLHFFAERVASEDDLLIFNTLSWEKDRLVQAPLRQGATAVSINGRSYPIQQHKGQTYFRAPLPSIGWTTARWLEESDSQSDTAVFEDGRITTPLYQIETGEDGDLAQIIDREQDKNILTEPGNQFQVFEDDPGKKFGAWDIAYHLEEYRYPVEQTASWHLVTNGPLFAIFASRWQVLDSTIEQEMILYKHDRRIDFVTAVDWQNSKKLLKVAFPLNIRSRTATYDLPFGHIERPTHRNTSWEQAKFEVSGHKWADLSQGDYGVALLNDCKYGYDVRDNVMRLSLVRSPVRPSPKSDIGMHHFTYSLLPHKGGWRQGQVVRRAYELNSPAFAVPLPDEGSSQGNVPASQSFLTVESDSLIVEVIKQAEVGNGIVLRTFDSHGSDSKRAISLACPIDQVEETNLLEQRLQSVSLHDKYTFYASHTPYEIKTHHIRPKTQR